MFTVDDLQSSQETDWWNFVEGNDVCFYNVFFTAHAHNIKLYTFMRGILSRHKLYNVPNGHI